MGARKPGIITKTITDIYIPNETTGEVTDSEITNTPRSERATSVPDPIDATPDDDYDILTTMEWFDDGKKRNPVTGVDEDI